MVAASGARLIRPALAQQPAAAPAAPRLRLRRRRQARARARRRAISTVRFPAARAIDKLNFDAWRDIRFKSDKPLLGQPGASFRLELFHLGYLYKRPVVVNVLRDGIPAPVPYLANLFDFGRNEIPGGLPINFGFAGFRLLYPLNAPRVMDEVISFLGASYYRFLGRGQRYGLSARGLGIGSGARADEEFPFFREFWIETPDPAADRIVIHALLDGESATGAFRFEIVPSLETSVDVTATLFARRSIGALAMAPLSSMFLRGKNDHRVDDDFRTELHDSDGLLMHTGAGEWIWRPLEQPGRAGVVDLPRRQRARLRAHPARPLLRALPGPRPRLRAAGRATGSSRARAGAKAASNSPSCRPTTKATTTSSPPGRPSRVSRPAAR